MKPESAAIIPFLSDMKPIYCPKPLSAYDAVEIEEIDEALNCLKKRVSQAVNTR